MASVLYATAVFDARWQVFCMLQQSLMRSVLP
jgi:hypothetical protein